MKRILIAVTAMLGMSLGSAVAMDDDGMMAEGPALSLSGSAGLGVTFLGKEENPDGSTSKNSRFEFNNFAKVTFKGAGVTDGGLTFGMKVRVNGSGQGGADGAVDDAEVHIGGDMWKVTVGDVDQASDLALALDDVGFDGNLGVDDVAEGIVDNNAKQARVDLTFGMATVGVSVGQRDIAARAATYNDDAVEAMDAMFNVEFDRPNFQGFTGGGKVSRAFDVSDGEIWSGAADATKRVEADATKAVSALIMFDGGTIADDDETSDFNESSLSDEKNYYVVYTPPDSDEKEDAANYKIWLVNGIPDRNTRTVGTGEDAEESVYRTPGQVSQFTDGNDQTQIVRFVVRNGEHVVVDEVSDVKAGDKLGDGTEITEAAITTADTNLGNTVSTLDAADTEVPNTAVLGIVPKYNSAVAAKAATILHQAVAADQKTDWALGVSFDLGVAKIGMGYDSDKAIQASVGGDFGDFGGSLYYAQKDDDDDVKHTSLGAQVNFSASDDTIVTAVFARHEADGMEDQNGFGVGVKHGLGGGAKVEAGFAQVKDQNKASVGVTMSF